jgi:uncharacterized protein with FMN-binding domain
MSQGGSAKKVSNSLVAWSSAAILAVFSAGFDRTKSAANRFELMSADRMPARSGYEKYRGSSNGLPAGVTRISPEPQSHRAPKSAKESDVPKAATPFAPPEPPTLTAFIELDALPAATPQAEIPAAPAPASHSGWKDGTYYGWGTSRHGDIQAEVVINGGRIASAVISECRTRYSCSVIDKLPPQVAQRQSPEVDYVSGATQSANAFYYAVVEALSQAK